AQGRAFGLWAGASGATTILGPFFGGALVDTLSWRVAFLINVPLCVLAVWATLAYVRESRDENATVAVPYLMVTRRDPLIPPALFRSRNFTVTNISTFLIYGALYVIGWFLTL